MFGAEEDTFVADPCEVELVSFHNSSGIVKKYRPLEDFHWAVRPAMIALCLSATIKFVSFVLGQSKRRPHGKESQTEAQSQQKPVIEAVVEAANGPGWLPLQLRV
ncbi:hypothetical protein CDL15_Pgr015655 [Punica granatum]|nr:hypothetical protein CDL15_Pgr015655 [Punica granatum]